MVGAVGVDWEGEEEGGGDRPEFWPESYAARIRIHVSVSEGYGYVNTSNFCKS